MDNAQVSSTISEQISADLEWVAELEEVLEVKTVSNRTGYITEVLVNGIIFLYVKLPGRSIIHYCSDFPIFTLRTR